MKIVEYYSYNGGYEVIKKEKPEELKEILEAIKSVNAITCKTKVSKEKTNSGTMLYSPVLMNKMILNNFLYKKGWKKPKISFPDKMFIEGDGVKNDLGLEVQFGKYAFLGWDIFGKMVIFAQQKKYKYGVEVVAMKVLQKQMSTGVGCFEQIVNLLKQRGISNLDIPVLVIGIDD